MGQQISIEAGLDSYRERASELFHENVLLKAHVKELQAQMEQLTAPPTTDDTPPSVMPPLDDGQASQAMR